MPKLVLFDFDDTLFNHVGTVRKVYESQIQLHPALSNRTLDEILSFHHRVLDELHPDILAGKYTPLEGRLIRHKRLFAYCGSELDDDAALAFTLESRDLYNREAHLNDGALDLLVSLKGRATVGVVTNNLRLEQVERMKQLEIDALVDFMVAYDDVQVMKPHPLMVERALELASADATETVLIGNSWESDVEAALVLGIDAIWLTADGETDHPKVTVVRSLSEAGTVIERGLG
jgi:putative hydrolase of the HAD superfamily